MHRQVYRLPHTRTRKRPHSEWGRIFATRSWVLPVALHHGEPHRCRNEIETLKHTGWSGTIPSTAIGRGGTTPNDYSLREQRLDQIGFRGTRLHRCARCAICYGKKRRNRSRGSCKSRRPLDRPLSSFFFDSSSSSLCPGKLHSVTPPCRGLSSYFYRHLAFSPLAEANISRTGRTRLLSSPVTPKEKKEAMGNLETPYSDKTRWLRVAF